MKNSGQGTGGTPSQTTDQWLDSALEQVFLSPRVVDERAFEELSGSLRALVKDAAGQSRALIATTGEVKLLGDQLREATRQLEAKVETAVRVIPTLDQRMKQAETLLEVTGRDLAAKVAAMQEAATRAVPIERERMAAQLRADASSILDQAVREQVGVLRERVMAELAALDAEVQARLQRVMAPFQEARGALGASLDALEARAAAVRAGLAADEARLSELSATLTGTVDRAVGQSAAAEAVAARVAESAARAQAAQGAIESAVTESGVRLGAAISEAERRAGEVSSRLGGQLDSVNAALAALHAEVEAARGGTPPARGKAEELERLGAWLEQLIGQGDKIGRGLSVLIQRAGQ